MFLDTAPFRGVVSCLIDVPLALRNSLLDAEVAGPPFLDSHSARIRQVPSTKPDLEFVSHDTLSVTCDHVVDVLSQVLSGLKLDGSLGFGRNARLRSSGACELTLAMRRGALITSAGRSWSMTTASCTMMLTNMNRIQVHAHTLPDTCSAITHHMSSGNEPEIKSELWFKSLQNDLMWVEGEGEDPGPGAANVHVDPD